VKSQDTGRDREGLDGSLARSPQLLFSAASFVRTSHRDLGEFAPTQQHAKRAKGKKCPISLRSSPRFQILRRETLHQPVLPCIARYNSYSSTTTRKLHHGREFHSRCLVLSPKKTFEFFFPSYFSIQCSTAPRCQKALTGTRTRATGHGC
jgi:hypothetical protein